METGKIDDNFDVAVVVEFDNNDDEQEEEEDDEDDDINVELDIFEALNFIAFDMNLMDVIHFGHSQLFGNSSLMTPSVLRETFFSFKQAG